MSIPVVSLRLYLKVQCLVQPGGKKPLVRTRRTAVHPLCVITKCLGLVILSDLVFWHFLVGFEISYP